MSVRPARWDQAERKIRLIPHYKAVQNLTVRQELLTPRELCPLCRVVRTYRLHQIEELRLAYEVAKIPLFQGVTLVRNGEPELLLPPPIIEEHNCRYVIIDGLHRLFSALQSDDQPVYVAVVRGALHSLPGDILTWSEIEVSTNKQPRHERFARFDVLAFRDVKRWIDEREQ